jgi:hypothetical protein
MAYSTITVTNPTLITQVWHDKNGEPVIVAPGGTATFEILVSIPAGSSEAIPDGERYLKLKNATGVDVYIYPNAEGEGVETSLMPPA